MKKIYFTLLFLIILCFFPSETEATAELLKIDESDAIFDTAQNTFGTLQSQVASGDIDNDGYLDVVIGDPQFSSNMGRVVIFWGGDDLSLNEVVSSTNYTQYQPDYNLGSFLRFGYVVNIADINNDTIDDLVVSARYYGYDGVNLDTIYGAIYVFYGGNKLVNLQEPDILIIGEIPKMFGRSISIDYLNTDDHLDFVTSGSYYNNNDGMVNIYFGPLSSTSTTSDTISAPSTGNYFGASVYTGDFNGDSKIDIISSVADNHLTPDKAYDHAAFVYFGDDYDNGYDLVLTNTYYANVSYADQPCFVFDFDYDGFDDFFLSDENSNAGAGNSQGSVSIFRGGLDFDSISDLDLKGEFAGDYFGRQMVNIGDLDNNGYEEIAIGSWGYPSGNKKGRVQIIKSGPNISSTFDWEIVGENNSDRKTVPIPTGDYNKNGYTDFMVLAYGYPSGAYFANLSLYELEHGNMTVETDISSQTFDPSNQTLSGTASNDTFNLKGVQISVDKNNWIECTAVDGAFDSLSEDFICDYSSLNLPNGDYEFFVRAYDENDVFMPEMLFAKVDIIAIAMPETGDSIAVTGVFGVVILCLSVYFLRFRKKVLFRS